MTENDHSKQLRTLRRFFIGCLIGIVVFSIIVWLLVIRRINNVNRSIDHRVSDAIHSNNDKYFVNP